MTSVEVPPIEVRRAKLQARETAVVVVDMQNDFVRRDGKLYVPSAEDTIKPIAELLGRARRAGASVIYTQDWHMKDDPEFRIWGEHALAGTWGAEIIEELAPAPDDAVIRKLRYDAFFGTSLDYLLRVRGIRNLVLVGTVANICVLHTAGSAALNWYNVALAVDGVSALTDFDLYSTLRQVSFLYKGTITKTTDIEFI
ncbi:isochorismatase [Thermocladium modestius]|uniref:Isochorismatase n=1 Tax=Thermocladium modestius TaxID=62609 RepID=A0A830GTI8_9CREN|nr:isochorismatase family cysteine hydrolase [Thermocladium modestius]GGP19093.1 isochorismatase [Thermocladium modestius]